MKVLMTSGGTAGHVYPALTVAERLRADAHEVLFVGTPDGIEARLCTEAGVPFEGVPARGFDRGRPVTLLTSGALTVAAVARALAITRRHRPAVVLGFGGYASLPVGLAALLARVPLVLHEQNSVPGLANRLLASHAHAIGITYEHSRAYLRRPERAVLTGNPVRASVLAGDRARGRAAIGAGEDDTVLLVFGGSRGAQHLNDAFVGLATELVAIPSLRVVHSAGRIEAASVAQRVNERLGGEHPRYRVVDYISEMGDALAAADLVVSRAGATSIAEITAVGRAAVLVPYPFATDDHQTLNARAVAEAGAAEVMSDAELDSERFRTVLLGLLQDPARRERMAAAAAGLALRDAAERLEALALQAVRTREETR